MNLFVLFGRPTSMMDAVRPPFAMAGEQFVENTSRSTIKIIMLLV